MSKDSPKALLNFKEKNNYPFYLVSDPEMETIKDYHAWVQKKLYGREYMGIARVTYLIDENGNIEKAYEKVSVKTHAEDVMCDLG